MGLPFKIKDILAKKAAYRLPRLKIPKAHPELLPGMAEHLAKQPFNHAEHAFQQGRISRELRDSILSGRRAEELRSRFEELIKYIKSL